MTLVAVWKSHGRLMAIADTRLIRDAGNVLTEHGPKLLPLPIVCRQPGPDGFFSSIVHSKNVGFAYCGSTLSALSAHALASVMFSNLIGTPATPPPSLEELASSFAGIALEYIREVGQLAGYRGQFSAVIFGFCEHKQALRGFEIKPRIEKGQIFVDSIERDMTLDNAIVVIGSNPKLLLDRIDEDRRARGDASPIVARDRPTRALQSIIVDGADDSVGGTIQQGWATPVGFEIVAKLMPIVPLPPSTRNAGLFVLGFDITETQLIGAHKVSLVGL